MPESEMAGELKRQFARIPRHIAVIMDGNGRWAKQRRLSRTEGHRNAVKAVRETVTTCRELGIEVLTLYAFSEENWNRPKSEVQALLALLKQFLKSELQEMLENDISFDTIGDLTPLPSSVRKLIEETRDRTTGGKKMHLSLALSYGSRSEIVQAARRIAEDVVQGKRKAEEITKEIFSRYLYTAGLPDPDLLIRTSGEMRISNFLLWQIAYTELWITPVLWPDFRREHILQAIEDYNRRERRYGRIEALETDVSF